MRAYYLLLIFISIPTSMVAQEDSSYVDFSGYVRLDSVMITAKRQGFSVPEFIKVIQQDNSLEDSFNELRALSYKYTNDITYFNRIGEVKASFQSTNIQHHTGKCQWMEVVESSKVGDYERYYTTDFYKRVFYKPTVPCKEGDVAIKPSRSARVLEKRIDELKKLIYTPGTEASVPLIGSKTAIFSEKMIQFYDFSLSARSNTYHFVASIKPHYNIKKPNGSVVKYLEIEMDRESFQVMSRNYKLQYNAGVYSFDILMKVKLRKHDGHYIPSEIHYDGYWKVAGRKKENCNFKFELIEVLSE